ncbi:MAG TPA: methylamine utilization protein [Casimicrobiaceae bacterium]|nr:methylamine utilization protein [Casimicrobiaceae bacterium]
MIRATVLPALLVFACATTAVAQSGSIAVKVTDPGSHAVADAVVVAVPSDGVIPVTAHPRAESLDQIDKEFVPRVKPIFVGSTVSFPNKDNVRHHVYSFSPAKRFELPLYAGVPAQPVLFDKAGVVVLGCNIHDWMIGYIYVSESPFFAKTGADGTAVIADVPLRGYSVRVWHPQLDGSEEQTRRTVEVNARRVEVAFTVNLKPEVRVRRAPAMGHAGHY